MLARVREARVTLVIGASDAGKTTLVAALAGALASPDVSVGVVDADVGQSEIGPPTTVGLGRVRGPIGRLGDAEVLGFQFVGVSSPPRDIAGVVDATRRMVERARAAGFAHVLLDTSGLVSGWPGRLLKQRKIDAVKPDLLLVLERGEDCAPIVERYAALGRPALVRLAARGRPQSRSQTARREYRLRAFERYLAGARSLALSRSRVEVQWPRGVDPADLAGALCGLDDAGGDTLALGVVETITAGTARVSAPLAASVRVARLRIGRERTDGTPLAPAPTRRPSTPVGDGRDSLR